MQGWGGEGVGEQVVKNRVLPTSQPPSTMIMCVYKRCSASTQLCLLLPRGLEPWLASPCSPILCKGVFPVYSRWTGGSETLRDTATVTTPTLAPSRAQHFLSSHQFLIYWIQGKITARGRGRRGLGGRRQELILGGENVLWLGGAGHCSDNDERFYEVCQLRE